MPSNIQYKFPYNQRPNTIKKSERNWHTPVQQHTWLVFWIKSSWPFEGSLKKKRYILYSLKSSKLTSETYEYESTTMYRSINYPQQYTKVYWVYHLTCQQPVLRLSTLSKGLLLGHRESGTRPSKMPKISALLACFPSKSQSSWPMSQCDIVMCWKNASTFCWFKVILPKGIFYRDLCHAGICWLWSSPFLCA